MTHKGYFQQRRTIMNEVLIEVIVNNVGSNGSSVLAGIALILESTNTLLTSILSITLAVG